MKKKHNINEENQKEILNILELVQNTLNRNFMVSSSIKQNLNETFLNKFKEANIKVKHTFFDLVSKKDQQELFTKHLNKTDKITFFKKLSVDFQANIYTKSSIEQKVLYFKSLNGNQHYPLFLKFMDNQDDVNSMEIMIIAGCLYVPVDKTKSLIEKSINDEKSKSLVPVLITSLLQRSKDNKTTIKHLINEINKTKHIKTVDQKKSILSIVYNKILNSKVAVKEEFIKDILLINKEKDISFEKLSSNLASLSLDDNSVGADSKLFESGSDLEM